MGEKPFQAAHISQIDGRLVDGGPQARRPVREYFDIGAFGVNAFTVAEAGEGLVEAHDELSGSTDAPAGTFVFVSDPGARRAHGRSDHIGGTVGPKDSTAPHRALHQDIVYAKGNPIVCRRLDFIFPDGTRKTVIRDGVLNIHDDA